MVDVESEAAWLLRGVDDVPGARALAKKHLGEGAVRTVPRHALPAAGACCWHLGRWTIFVRAGLTPAELRWTLMHEIAEWHLKQLGYAEPDTEEVCHAIAAALVCPRLPFIRRARSDRDLASLATSFATTQTSVALRLAETGVVEAAVVVRPGLVYVRAPDGFVLPDERGLRRAANDGHAILERHPLTDSRRRVALLAA